MSIETGKTSNHLLPFIDPTKYNWRHHLALWAEMAIMKGLKPALHLHHKANEEKALSLVKMGLINGIKEFDSSIGGLGGCPFTENSGSNLSTETLVRHLNAWGFDCGLVEGDLQVASVIATRLLLAEKEAKLPVLL